MNIMKLVTYKKLGEKIYHEKLPNDLDVFILPKKSFYKAVVTFTTKFGSVDKKFMCPERDRPTQVTDGIAHFLEHQMFKSDKDDVLHTFAKKDTISNAFTNSTSTEYTLSATSDINKNLITLLNFVQEAYFTDETIEKEKGIIEQEIKMYEDNPDWRARLG